MPNRSIRDQRSVKPASRDPAGYTRLDNAATGEPIRNTAGPASDAVRKAALAQRLAESEPPDSRPQPPKPAAPGPRLGINPTRNIRIARQRRDDQLERNSSGEP